MSKIQENIILDITRFHQVHFFTVNSIILTAPLIILIIITIGMIVKLRIFGMKCEDCVRTVEYGLKASEGVKDVYISLKEGVGTVQVDDKLAPESLLRLPVFGPDSQYKAQVVSVE